MEEAHTHVRPVAYMPELWPDVEMLYASQGAPPIPAAAIPRGCIIYKEQSKYPIAFGILYVEKPLAFLAFLVTNHHAQPSERHAALDALIVCLCDEAKTLGCQMAMVAVGPELRGRHERHGFSVGDEQVSTLFKNL